MKKRFTNKCLLFVIFFLFFRDVYSQTRPNVDLGSSDEFSQSGICLFCTTSDHENAYDNDENTYAEITTSIGLLTTFTAHYEFQENVPTGNEISLILALDATGSILNVVDGIITTDVLSDVNVVLNPIL